MVALVDPGRFAAALMAAMRPEGIVTERGRPSSLGTKINDPLPWERVVLCVCVAKERRRRGSVTEW